MRRTRYTVYYDDDKPEVCLAYTPEGARKLFEKLGHSVIRVERGDYRKTRTGGGFVINKAALADAIELLGLKLPVKVRTHARVGDTNGNYRLRDGWHDIMLKSYHTPEQASSTLWHELTHAMQAERAGGKDEWRSVRNEQRRYSYRIRPIEVEAREMSEAMADIPLCRPA